MLDAAGSEKRPWRITAELAARRDAEIAALRADGWSVNRIAASFGLSNLYVRAVLALAGAAGEPPAPRRHGLRPERAFGSERWRVLDPSGRPVGPLHVRREDAQRICDALDAPPVRTHCRCCGADLARKNRRRKALHQSLCADCLDHGYDRRTP